ncbi:MAG: ABC transporter ATP-binding protein [Proteobacteria bacterium]|nr:ABC transporter ATP-binding protein [Pseudomonadota bacterium]
MAAEQETTRFASLWRSAAPFFSAFASYAGRRGLWVTLWVALGAILEGFGIVLLIPILAVVTDSGTTKGWIHELALKLFIATSMTTRLGQLAALLAAFATLMLIRALVISARDTMLARLQMGFVDDRRSRIMHALAAARWDQVMALRHARITHLLSGDIQRLSVASHVLQQCAVALVMLLVQCALAFLLSPLLTGITFALLIAAAATMTPMLIRSRNLGRLVTRGHLALANSAGQFLGGLKLAVAQNLQKSFVDEFDATQTALRESQIGFIRQQTLARTIFITLFALVGALAVFVGYGIYQIPPSILIALLLIFARISGPAIQIQQGAQQLAQSLPAFEELRALETELEQTAPLPSNGVTGVNGAIELRAVNYRHTRSDEDSESGLNGVSLTIEEGEFLGVGGPSGGGKTTFADLLVGLLTPQQGLVMVGGKPLAGARLTAWRNAIAYVSQDPFLFHDTVRRNLLWANPGASESEIWAALAFVGADDFVRRLESGLDTIVGERGTLMSGGERQRIALARGLLRKPVLLVLDEATNAIDIKSEHDILGRLAKLSPRPTIVMIAHRRESLALCDRAVTIDKGHLSVPAHPEQAAP